jgi:hypothetical protein
MPEKPNPYSHVPRCQSSSEIALSCPACRWSLLKWSVPRPGQSLEQRLTVEDEIWLAKMNISLVGTSRRNARSVPSAEVGNG